METRGKIGDVPHPPLSWSKLDPATFVNFVIFKTGLNHVFVGTLKFKMRLGPVWSTPYFSSDPSVLST